MSFSKRLKELLTVALTHKRYAEELETLINEAKSSGSNQSNANTAQRLTITRTAGESISALKLVRNVSGDLVITASSDVSSNSVILGMALNSASPGGDVEILTFGVHRDPLFAFDINAALFLGPGGDITEEIPNIGINLRVGHSLGNSQIMLNITEPIQLVS